MSNKFKKLVRSVSESSGVSHAGAVNLLRRGSRTPLRPLDPVLIREDAKPLFGEHTHCAGIVSAVLPDGTVCVTPAWPRVTLGGLSFFKHEKIARYRADDVSLYRLKKGERFARFVESVFDEVPYDRDAAYTSDETPWIFTKPDGGEAFVIGENNESIIAVSRPKRVVIPLWECSADLVEDGVVVGQDAVKTILAVRDRMVAMMACTIYPLDLSNLPADGLIPDRVPEDCSWIVDVDRTVSTDVGMILDPSEARRFSVLNGRYACGKKKVGRHVVASGSRGILLLRSDVTVVSLR